MTIAKLQNRTFSLLLVSIFFTSCNGQPKTAKPIETVVDQLSFTSKKPKLTKTLGTTEHQNVHCSLQDRNGNLWFGTTGEGVFRYDGIEFTQFTEKDGLSSNTIWSILEDNSGNIWFGTDDGISHYNGKTISIIPILSISSAIAQSGKISIWSMMQDRTGIIWLGTSNDLFCYDGNSFSRFLDKFDVINNQNLQLKWIQCFLEDSNGIIWMGSGPIAKEGIVRFNGKSIASSKPNGDGWIRYIIEDKNKYIWISGRNNGVFHYDGHSFKHFTEKANIGSAIFNDKNGNIWFDGGEKINSVESIDGLWRYDGKAFENFTAKDGLDNYSVWSMLEDSNGFIWIGTRNCGLYRFNGEKFERFSE